MVFIKEGCLQFENLSTYCGVSTRKVELLRSWYESIISCLRMDGDDGEWFPIRTRLRQGCVMSSSLFNVYMDAMMRKVTEGTAGGVMVGRKRVVGDGGVGHANGGSNKKLRNKYQCEEERAAVYRHRRRQC